jgi:hypothetical protein
MLQFEKLQDLSDQDVDAETDNGRNGSRFHFEQRTISVRTPTSLQTASIQKRLWIWKNEVFRNVFVYGINSGTNVSQQN